MAAAPAAGIGVRAATTASCIYVVPWDRASPEPREERRGAALLPTTEHMDSLLERRRRRWRLWRWETSVGWQ